MKLSVVVPLFNHAENIYSFVDEVATRAQNLSDEYEIIVATNQEFEFVEKLHDRLKNSAHIIAVRESDDYQQVVMAGVDRADGDATIIMTPEYSPALMDDMVSEWRAGKEVVCLRRKHGKVGQFITKLRLKIYNLFLFMFGDIFSIGILKDAQLLDKKIVDKMKAEQDFAHRVRTMYAPLDYNTTVFNIEHQIERFETKGAPKFDFWLGAIGAVVTLLAMITAFALAGALHAPIWFWTIVVIFGLIFEFVFIALLVNATARVKIGILHNVDEQGRIYNVVQEYHKESVLDEKIEQSRTTQKNETTPKKTATARKTATKKVGADKGATKNSENVGALNGATKKATTKEVSKVAEKKSAPKKTTKVDISKKEISQPANETTAKASAKKTTTPKKVVKNTGALKEVEPKETGKKATTSKSKTTVTAKDVTANETPKEKATKKGTKTTTATKESAPKKTTKKTTEKEPTLTKKAIPKETNTANKKTTTTKTSATAKKTTK